MNRSRLWTPVAALALLQALLFAYYLRETMIRQPFWDMYSLIMRFLQFKADGNWWSYFWEPHVQHRLIWMKLLAAVDVEVFSGTSYPFIVFTTACQLGTAWLIWHHVRANRPDPRGGVLACLAVMLVLTSVAAVDCGIPMHGIYPQALVFVVGALVLFDAPDADRRVALRRVAAMGTAVAGAFANTAALVVWPILVWYSWRTRAGWHWTAVMAVTGTIFSLVYIRGLPVAAEGNSTLAGVLSGAEIQRAATYLFTYLGLPWTRAASLQLVGQAAGVVLFVASVASVIRFGFLRQTDRLQRFAVALIAFSLATACLAAAGRVHVPSAAIEGAREFGDSDVLVPVRYSVFVAPMHVGLLLLGWPLVFGDRRVHVTSTSPVMTGGRGASDRMPPHNLSSREYIAAVVFSFILVVQQLASGEQAAATTRSMRAVLNRFAAGEQADDMRSVVFVDLSQARRDFNVLHAAGLYTNAR
jgi:hypothetical protein